MHISSAHVIVKLFSNSVGDPQPLVQLDIKSYVISYATINCGKTLLPFMDKIYGSSPQVTAVRKNFITTLELNTDGVLYIDI